MNGLGPELCFRALRSCGLEMKSCRELSSKTLNHVFICELLSGGKEVVVRFAKDDEHVFWGNSKAKYVSEALAMAIARKHFEEEDICFVPSVLGSGVDEHLNRPFLVMEKVEGVPLRSAAIEDKEALARRLMFLVQSLCNVPIGDARQIGSFGGCGLCFDGPILEPCDSIGDFVRRMMIWSEDACDDLEGKQLLSACRDKVANMASRNAGKLVFRHGDLSIDNIMLTKEGKLCLIDWEFAGIYDERDVYLETSKKKKKRTEVCKNIF